MDILRKVGSGSSALTRTGPIPGNSYIISNSGMALVSHRLGPYGLYLLLSSTQKLPDLKMWRHTWGAGPPPPS